MLYKDANVLNLDYDKLEQGGSVTGIGGRVNSYYLKDVTITFGDSEPLDHQETLDKILVLRDFSQSEEQRRDLFKIPSVIGMDILRKYTIMFLGEEVELVPGS